MLCAFLGFKSTGKNHYNQQLVATSRDNSADADDDDDDEMMIFHLDDESTGGHFRLAIRLNLWAEFGSVEKLKSLKAACCIARSLCAVSMNGALFSIALPTQNHSPNLESLVALFFGLQSPVDSRLSTVVLAFLERNRMQIGQAHEKDSVDFSLNLRQQCERNANYFWLSFAIKRNGSLALVGPPYSLSLSLSADRIGGAFMLQIIERIEWILLMRAKE